MPLDGLNAAAAVAILNKAGVANDVKARGVLLAALTPGLLGIAVPIVMANKAAATSIGATSATQPLTGAVPTASTNNLTSSVTLPTTVVIPDVSTSNFTTKEAAATLKRSRLFASVQQTYDSAGEKDRVVHQDPVAGTLVNLDSTVTIFANAGSPPPVIDPNIDVDQELIHKIALFRADFDRTLARIESKVGAKPSGRRRAAGRTSRAIPAKK